MIHRVIELGKLFETILQRNRFYFDLNISLFKNIKYILFLKIAYTNNMSFGNTLA